MQRRSTMYILQGAEDIKPQELINMMLIVWAVIAVIHVIFVRDSYVPIAAVNVLAAT
jgi:hypothetical protein